MGIYKDDFSLTFQFEYFTCKLNIMILKTLQLFKFMNTQGLVNNVYIVYLYAISKIYQGKLEFRLGKST